MKKEDRDRGHFYLAATSSIGSKVCFFMFQAKKTLSGSMSSRHKKNVVICWWCSESKMWSTSGDFDGKHMANNPSNRKHRWYGLIYRPINWNQIWPIYLFHFAVYLQHILTPIRDTIFALNHCPWTASSGPPAVVRGWATRVHWFTNVSRYSLMSVDIDHFMQNQWRIIVLHCLWVDLTTLWRRANLSSFFCWLHPCLSWSPPDPIVIWQDHHYLIYGPGPGTPPSIATRGGTKIKITEPYKHIYLAGRAEPAAPFIDLSSQVARTHGAG